MLFKTLISTLLLFLAACDSRQDAAAGFSAMPDEPAELYIHSRPDHLPEGLLAAFEKETGIKVHHDLFDTQEELDARLANQQTGYDLVVPDASFARAQIGKGLFLPLDPARAPGLAQLDGSVMAAIAQADPGNRHLVPWAWSFTTVGINHAKVKNALAGQPLPANSWELVFNPLYTRKLKDCGIVYRSSAADILPAALQYLGLNPYSDTSADYHTAARMLAQVRPDIKKFTSGVTDDLAESRACVVIGWASEINRAADQVRDGGGSERIEALLPGNGVLAFFDTLAIPADAPHPGNAHKFIEFFLRPENAALMVTDLGYGTGSVAAQKLLKADVANNPSVFLPESHAGKIIPLRQLSGDAADAAEQVFATFLSGVSSPRAKAP